MKQPGNKKSGKFKLDKYEVSFIIFLANFTNFNLGIHVLRIFGRQKMKE